MLDNQYRICVGGNNILKLVDPKGVTASVDIAINGEVLYVESNSVEAYCISETSTTSFLTKVNYSNTPVIVFEIDLGVMRVGSSDSSMVIYKELIYIYIDQTLIEIDLEGTEVRRFVLGYVSGKIKGINELGLIILSHSYGTDILENGISKINIGTVFQDIAVLDREIVGFAGNTMYVMNAFLYEINRFDIMLRVEKVAALENNVIVGFAYDGTGNSIYEFDKDTGAKSFVVTLNEIVSCVSFSNPSTVIFDSDPGWVSGTRFEVKGANIVANNSFYTIVSNVGATYTVAETTIVDDTEVQGTATKYNTPESVTEFFIDRYGRYYLIDGETVGDIWYGLGTFIGKNSYVAEVPLAAGKNQAGYKSLLSDSASKNWRIPFNREGVASQLYSSMVSKEGIMTMYNYLKTIKVDETNGYIVTSNNIVEIDNTGIMTNSYTINRAIVDADIDDRFIWLLTVDSIVVLHRKTMTYYKEFAYNVAPETGKHITSFKNSVVLVTTNIGIYKTYSIFGVEVESKVCDYPLASGDMVHFGGHPIFSYSSNNIIVPISGATGATDPVPVFVMIGRGGEISGFSEAHIPQAETYNTQVLPDSRGNVYSIWRNSSADIVLGEGPEGAGTITSIILGADVEYDDMGVGLFGDIILLKKNDNISDRGIYVHLKSGTLTGEVLYYKLAGDNQMKGILGTFDKVVLGVNSELVGWSGNISIEKDIKTWIGYNVNNNKLTLLATGIQHYGTSLEWNITINISVDGIDGGTHSMSNNGDGIYRTDIELVSVPGYIVADFSIEDIVTNIIVKSRKIISFTKR